MENGKRNERKHRLRTVRNKTSVRLDYILLGVILLVAAMLRLWKLGQVPFMHDEFSALFRLQFDNFHDLVQNGIKIDGHPAGVQTFLYYWSKVVGWNAFWLKLPFALMGIGSIALIYVIGKQWFNRKVGLLAAAFFAVSQFTVFYSQIIRPYAAGLFFVLFFTYFWNRLLFDPKKPRWGVCIGFAVTAWLAALAHNFSAAQAGLIFLTGLFFLKRERRLPYWLSGVGALLLYSPNIPIFYHQTFVNGGIGGWLAMPENTFLIDFVQYTMHYAPLFMFTVGLAIILPLILGKTEKRRRPIRWAAVAWFVIIFALAWGYSLLVEPIIQFSTLFFCYPFLILALFSLYRNNTMTLSQTVIVIAAILFIGTSTLIVNRRHYDLMYHQGFDQIAVRMKHDSDSLGNIRFATVAATAKMADYYQSATQVNDRVVFDGDNDVADLRQWTEEGDSQLLGFAWTDYASPAWEMQAVASYPWLVSEDVWFTSKYLTLAKDSVAGACHLLRPLTDKPMNFVNTEWGTAFRVYGDSLDANTDLVGVAATIQAIDTLQHCVLVMEVRDSQNDSLLLWQGNSEACGTMTPGTHILTNAIRFDKKKFPVNGTVIKTYLWNQSRGTMIVKKMESYTTLFNTKLTGLYEPL